MGKKDKGVEQAKALTPPLNEDERMAVELVKNKKNDKPIAFTATEDGKKFNSCLDVDRGTKEEMSLLYDAAMLKATGSADTRFANLLFTGCFSSSAVCLDGTPDDKAKNMAAIFNTMSALNPQDEVEGMLTARLVSLHFQSMLCLNRSSHPENSSEVCERNANRAGKFMRLYNETLETLMRYRRRGEQKVTVTHQHVNVGNGGQAVVGGTVVAGGGGGAIKN